MNGKARLALTRRYRFQNIIAVAQRGPRCRGPGDPLGGVTMKAKMFVALLGACALLPAASSATTFTYIPIAGDAVPSFYFTTTLSGAALDNLPAGTNILATLTARTFAPVPPTDINGIPIGGPLGSPYLNPTSGHFLIGTNGAGQITSWDIAESFFASYPLVPGGDPFATYCTYDASTTPAGNLVQLTGDNAAPKCSDGKESAAGTFVSDAAATPLPAALPLFASGLSALGLVGWRRKKNATARAA